MKRDGHTHTQFCRHGSGEETEAFILKAIAEGFQVYSFTEHPPLPESLLAEFPYHREFKEELQILGNDFDAYIREMQRLKHKYRERINLLVGAEVDYLPGHTAETRYFLKEYGPYLEDSLLSVHIIKGNKGWRALDHNPDDFREGLLDLYGSYEEVQVQYYQNVREAVLCDLGRYKPRRLSHLSLCNKFQGCFNPTSVVGPRVKAVVLDLLSLIKEKGCSLDFNVAGLFKTHCREVYPAPWIIKLAREYGIPLIYGSDSHAVADVGRAYDVYEQLTGADGR